MKFQKEDLIILLALYLKSFIDVLFRKLFSVYGKFLVDWSNSYFTT